MFFPFQTVQPYFVMTKMSKLRRANIYRPTPEQYVKYSLNTLGREMVTCGYPSHAFLVCIFKERLEVPSVSITCFHLSIH